jgi:hypothetical protein
MTPILGRGVVMGIDSGRAVKGVEKKVRLNCLQAEG